MTAGIVRMFLVGLMVSTLPSEPLAQVARQGTVGTNADPNAFTSPMVLEASFVAADRSIWGNKSWHEGPDYRSLGKYTCDGIALRGDPDRKTKEAKTGLAMRAKELPGDRLEVTVGLWLWLNPSHNHDKLVTVFLEVLDGSQVVAHTTLGPIGVEDKGYTKPVVLSFVIPMAALANGPATKMRLTMTTKDY